MEPIISFIIIIGGMLGLRLILSCKTNNTTENDNIYFINRNHQRNNTPEEVPPKYEDINN